MTNFSFHCLSVIICQVVRPSAIRSTEQWSLVSIGLTVKQPWTKQNAIVMVIDLGEIFIRPFSAYMRLPGDKVRHTDTTWSGSQRLINWLTILIGCCLGVAHSSSIRHSQSLWPPVAVYLLLRYNGHNFWSCIGYQQLQYIAQICPQFSSKG